MSTGCEPCMAAYWRFPSAQFESGGMLPAKCSASRIVPVILKPAVEASSRSGRRWVSGINGTKTGLRRPGFAGHAKGSKLSPYNRVRNREGIAAQ
jgi:hypothetical protein